MQVLVQLFGWPHELLHVLALRLIGRKPLAVSQVHVVIPDDLSTKQYIFVAGLPALIFWIGMAVSVLLLLNAPDLIQAVLGVVLTVIFSLAALSTIGDLHLILVRLLEEQQGEL
ncbi:MAG: metalloprotease family protein [Anaerolineae bacterium]|nr:metalloprotease family protein [Anaerolineae bacterium]